ncbi:uncharacterized protein DUF998 [Kribbella sp. VKM Ac-2571]|uniref:DUF998 domain-containing protein n=1 Tax=Kribbella sp. VKM Ac-2571 TaxID=2512222 RepID=UPI00105C424A|nr:DUF998 domain-containing protein [Kribbella sp. VKM Ac-2571]TDO66439.1 uncharacterized protein DUF998 [Kribbella sp. VKM Ac-2571]
MPTTATQSEKSAPPRLLAGALAGPLYVGIGTVEAIVRDGYDIRRHSLSLLANGAGGWIHSTMMVVTGLLTVVGALALRRAGVRSRWAWGGILVYGAGVAAAGLMRADPMDGFPIGTPPGLPETTSWHSLGHMLSGFIGFVGLIVACFVLARAFRREGDGRWSAFSLVTGIVYLLGLIGIATGGGTKVFNLGFTVAVIVGWAWLTLLMIHLRTEGLR